MVRDLKRYNISHASHLNRRLKKMWLTIRAKAKNGICGNMKMAKRMTKKPQEQDSQAEVNIADANFGFEDELMILLSDFESTWDEHRRQSYTGKHLIKLFRADANLFFILRRTKLVRYHASLKKALSAKCCWRGLSSYIRLGGLQI